MVAVDVDITPLVEAARHGDANAWDQLLRRYQLPLFTFVHALVHHEHTSFDIVQETFITAVRHLGTLRAEERFGAWLFGIAHQKCVQQWRRATRDRLVFDANATELPLEVAGPEDEAPSAWLVRRECADRFVSALDELSPAHRAVVVLHFLEEFSLEQIAAITATPLGTVKSRLHYAKRRLRERLEERP